VWQETVSVFVSYMSMFPQSQIPPYYYEPEEVKITGTLSVTYGRSGGINAQPDPNPHHITAHVDVYGFDEAEPLWLGDPLFKGLQVGIASQTYYFSEVVMSQGSESIPFEIQFPYDAQSGKNDQVNAQNPGRIRWGVSFEEPNARLLEIDGSHGPFMLANAADIVLHAHHIKYYARYASDSTTWHFCDPTEMQGGLVTERTCESIDLSQLSDSFAKWDAVLAKAYIPGSVTVTVDGTFVESGVDFVELDHAAGTVRFLTGFPGAQKMVICFFPEP